MQEQIVEHVVPRGTLRGIVHTPTGHIRQEAVFLHGYFTSNRIGPARLYVQLSRLLAERHVRVWRFDAFGVGDSDGGSEDVTFEGQVADYRSIVDRVQKAAEGHRSISLVSHSAGTNVAVWLASQVACLSELLLISPSFGEIHGIELLLTASQRDELSRRGTVTRKGLVVRQDYMQALAGDDVFQACANLPQHLIMIRPEQDQYYSMRGIQRVKDRVASCELFTIPDADHNFVVGQSRAELILLLRRLLQARRDIPSGTQSP